MAVGEAGEKQRAWNVLLLLIAAVFGAFTVSIFHEARVRFAWDMKSTDLVTILLAGAALILTSVGIFVAILAFWGWSNIRRDSIAASRREAVRCVDKYTASPDFDQKVEAAALGWLQSNFDDPKVRALLAEREREMNAMSELDAAQVDDAWGEE